MSHLLKITLIGLACFGFSACKETTSPQQASRDTGITTVDMGLAVDKGSSNSRDATQIRDIRVMPDAGRQVNDASTSPQDDANDDPGYGSSGHAPLWWSGHGRGRLSPVSHAGAFGPHGR